MYRMEPQSRENVFSTITEVVHSVVGGARVVLFGSHARGQATPASDYDLLIVIDKSLDAGRKLALRTRIRKGLLEEGIFSDVLVQSEQEIQQKKDLPGHIVRSILREGVVL